METHEVHIDRGKRARWAPGQASRGMPTMAPIPPARQNRGDHMDRVILSGMRCWMRVGVTSEERRTPQECLVDVELEGDLSRPMRSDDLRDSIDYGRVHALTHDLSQAEEFALLERFAGRLEEELRRAMSFGSMTIRVKKLHPPLPGVLDYAGIEVRRSGAI